MGEASRIFAKLDQALEHDTWHSTARPNQIAPDGDWSIWLLLAGRGFGKTRAAAEWVRHKVETGNARNIAIVGATASDVRDTMVEGCSGLLAISPSWNRPTYEPSKRRLTWPNGAIATMFSSEEPDRLRGPNHDLAWCDELSSWSNMQEVWDMLQMTLRIGVRPQVCISATPKPSKLLKDLVSRNDGTVVISRGSTFENRANLAPAFLDSIVRKYEGTRIGRQELNAELLEDVEGALWTRDMIEKSRILPDTQPPMRRIVVSIDPAVSVSETSDATGIIVAGLGSNGHGYVLQDLSGKFSPTEWAQKAIHAFYRLRADRIIAESNQGGLMVENTIRAVDRNVPVKLIHASRGKITRAEPVSAFYEQGLIHHVGAFPELEDEMATFEAGSRDSPDRLDAMVHAMTELKLSNVGPLIVTELRI